jgi:hypothetical protein
VTLAYRPESNNYRLLKLGTFYSRQVMWDDVIGEPEGIASPNCTWTCSQCCFRTLKNITYVLMTVVFAPFAAACLGVQFACLSCCVRNTIYYRTTWILASSAWNRVVLVERARYPNLWPTGFANGHHLCLFACLLPTRNPRVLFRRNSTSGAACRA